MQRFRLVSFVFVLTLGFIVEFPSTGYAQQGEVPEFASAMLPVDHWSFRAVRRIEALGLTDPGHSWGDMTMTRREAGLILARAVSIAERESPAMVPMVRGYYDRFTEEFPATVAALLGLAPPGARLLDGSTTAGFDVHRGRLLAGTGYHNDRNWTGPRPLEDESSVTAGLSWGTQYFPYVTASLTPVVEAGDFELGEAYLMGGWRGVILWAGRYVPAFGQGETGGIVLSGATSFDGGGFFLDDPVELPGVLGRLGPIRFSTFLSRMDQNRFELPWIWGARGSFQPHPRLTFGANRAVMFGGRGNGSVDLRNIAYIIIGKHAGSGSEFDNQIVSFDLRYRPPVGWLPLALYVEWGMEDSAGAWRDVPGIIAGVELPMIPGVPALAAGIERTSFGPSCCGNPIWYRHWRFTEGWTDDGILLGHPLGGHGREWLAYASADVWESRVRLTTRMFTRDRGEENVFAPLREGESVGGLVRMEMRPLPRAELVVQGGTERGSEGDAGRWRETRASMGVRFLF